MVLSLEIQKLQKVECREYGSKMSTETEQHFSNHRNQYVAAIAGNELTEIKTKDSFAFDVKEKNL